MKGGGTAHRPAAPPSESTESTRTQASLEGISATSSVSSVSASACRADRAAGPACCTHVPDGSPEWWDRHTRGMRASRKLAIDILVQQPAHIGRERWTPWARAGRGGAVAVQHDLLIKHVRHIAIAGTSTHRSSLGFLRGPMRLLRYSLKGQGTVLSSLTK